MRNLDDKPSPPFSIIIKDALGNTIEVSRTSDKPDVDKINPTKLTINAHNGKTEVGWQVSKLQARGFALYRTEKGKTTINR